MSARTGWLLLWALIAVAAAWRCSWVLADPTFSLEDDTGLYWSENATQYRHARMVALTGGLPELDLRAESPQGLQVKQAFTVLPEVAEGWLYRALVPTSVPFHVFLAMFLCVVSCLSAAAVYGAGRVMGASALASLLAAALYLTSSAAASSVLIHEILKEDFTLPFYFAHLACLLGAWRQDSKALALWSGAFLYVSLAAWHLVPSALLVEVGALTPFVLFGAADRSLAKALRMLTASGVAAALTLPTLRAQGFLVSMPLMSLAAIALAASVALRVPSRAARAGLWLFPLALSMLWGRLNHQEFSHTYALIAAKVRFLGQEPDDPSRIGWEAAAMWNSSFLSPTWAAFRTFFGPLALAAVAGLGLSLRRVRSWTRQEWFLLLMTAGYAVLYLLIQRMDCFLAFFLATQTAGLLPRTEDGVPQTPWRLARLGPALASVGLLLFSTWWLAGSKLWAETAPPGPLLQLIKAVRHQVPEDAAVLAEFQLSPSILAFTERPTVLHSKFETKALRDQVRRFEESLFGDEEAFWNYCRERQAKYFVYTASLVPYVAKESVRYRINRLGSVAGSAALAMHAHPEELKRFQLVWSNSAYTLYRVLEPGQLAPENRRPYYRVYDPKVVPIPGSPPG